MQNIHLFLRLVKRRRYRDFMERCTNHAYLLLETTEEAMRFQEEIHLQSPLHLTARVIALGEDDRPTPTPHSGEEDSKPLRNVEKVGSPQMLKGRRTKNGRGNVDRVNSSVFPNSVIESKLLSNTSESSATFEEITIHEPKVLRNVEDSFHFNTPIILSDVKKSALPPCAACYQPAQYLCRQSLKEAYCSRNCQVQCVVGRKKAEESSKKGLENLSKSDNCIQSNKSLPINKISDEPYTADNTINSSIPRVEDMKFEELALPSRVEKTILTNNVSRDDDSSSDSLPPFKSFRKTGHPDDRRASNLKEDDSTLDSPPPPVTNLKIICNPGMSCPALPSEKDWSSNAESVQPYSSSNRVSDLDSSVSIPLPSFESDSFASSYSTFSSTKMQDEVHTQRFCPLNKDVGPPPTLGWMRDQDLNGNPSTMEDQHTETKGQKECLEDSSSASEDSGPPFKYFRDEGSKMVPVSQNNSLVADDKDKLLNVFTNLGEAINNLQLTEGLSNRKAKLNTDTTKKKQAHKETQTDLPSFVDRATQTILEGHDKGTQISLPTAQKDTQTDTMEGIVRIKERHSNAMSTNTDKLPAAAGVITSLSPDEPRSYFSLPHSDFEARILYFKSESQFFICTNHKSAQLEQYQVRLIIENLLQIWDFCISKHMAYAGNLQTLS